MIVIWNQVKLKFNHALEVWIWELELAWASDRFLENNNVLDGDTIHTIEHLETSRLRWSVLRPTKSFEISS